MKSSCIYEKRGFKYLLLSDSEKEFLTGYAPQDTMFTTKEEMERVAENLHFKDLTAEEMHALRNSVVKHYQEIREQYERLTPPWDRIWNAMMSVTAVIDSSLLTMGEPV